MVDNTFADVLTIAQTVGIIGTMLMTLYFSRKQVQSISVDVETRVLNDLDEKIHRMGELLIERPKLLQVIAKGRTNFSKKACFLIMCFSYAHTHTICEKEKVLNDNEWAGWLAWMKNAFTFGKIRQDWLSSDVESWFDPSFRDFINKEIIAATTAE